MLKNDTNTGFILLVNQKHIFDDDLNLKQSNLIFLPEFVNIGNIRYILWYDEKYHKIWAKSDFIMKQKELNVPLITTFTIITLEPLTRKFKLKSSIKSIVNWFYWNGKKEIFESRYSDSVLYKSEYQKNGVLQLKMF